MNLDIKVPMGWFFLITGVLIAGYGEFIADPVIYQQRSLGYNVNLYWGIVLAIFGAVSLLLRNKGPAKK
ncbi:MAG: hypothetical protein NTU80_10325 [Verrucomicrobia bacterium]|nr:hypothetical protein [Verrucomicrobiota bacterium]